MGGKLRRLANKFLFSAAATFVLGTAVLGVVGFVSTETAPAAVPLGNACNPTDGKIDGLGATVQGTAPGFVGYSTHGAQYQWWTAYGQDICGDEPASPVDDAGV